MYQVDPGGGISECLTVTYDYDHDDDDNDSNNDGVDQELHLHVIGRHQHDSQMTSRIKSLIAMEMKKSHDKSASVSHGDSNKMQDNDEDGEENIYTKTAMIVADSFLRQVDPPLSSSSTVRKNRNRSNESDIGDRDDKNGFRKCVDVWMIRPDQRQRQTTSNDGQRRPSRGGIITTCYRNINLHHTEAILQQQQQQDHDADNDTSRV
jgi:hypothetical protein